MNPWLRLLLVTASVGALPVPGTSSLVRALGQQSQPHQQQAPTKYPEIIREGTDGSPIAVPRFLICDYKTFLNCHKVAGVTPPKLVHSVNATFPNEARQFRLEGLSVVKLIVDEKGHPRNVTTIRSFADKLPPNQHEAGLKMDESAINAVKKYRFQPATLNGKPVPTEVTIEVNFHLL